VSGLNILAPPRTRPGIRRCAVEVERFSYSSTLVSLTSGHWLDPRMTVIGGKVLAASSDAKRCSGDTSKSQLLERKREFAVYSCGLVCEQANLGA
jgi:hypothetical protein